MWWLVVCLLILFLFYDVYYTIWTCFTIAKSLIYNRIAGHLDLFTTQKTWGMCTTTDLDFMCHMNNARYLRNADSSRFEFFVRTGIWDAAKRKNGHLVVGATTIRFRREIKLFETFRIHCKLLCWDENSFYIEHKYERCRDNFISAIFIVKQRAVKTTPAEIIEELLGKGINSPNIPDDVKSWIQSNEISSQNLRKTN